MEIRLHAMILGALFVALATRTMGAASAASEQNGWEPFSINLSDTELDQEIAALDKPDTQVEAIGKIVRFAGTQIFNGHGSVVLMSQDQARDKREKRADEALQKYANYETFTRVLKSPDVRAKFWALFFFRQKMWQDHGANHAEVNGFLPVLRTIAADDPDAMLRGQAQQDLAAMPDQQEFLQGVASAETEPGNIMRLMYGGNGKGYSERMNTQLLRLLASPDAKVRERALNFMSLWNYNSAPMWQVKFSLALLSRIIELTNAGESRAAAAGAAARLRDLDPQKVDSVLATLAADPDPEVRRNVVMVIFMVPADQVKHLPATHPTDPAIRKLLEIFHTDPDPEVRYFAILGLDPPSEMADLEQLAMCPNPQIASMAIERLKAYRIASPVPPK